MNIIKLTGMVNFICQLDWIRDTQIAGEILFLGLLARGFQKRVAFELPN